MKGYEALIERIRDDVRCGGKMGAKSTFRLLDILSQLAQDVDKMQRDAERAKQPRTIQVHE